MVRGICRAGAAGSLKSQAWRAKGRAGTRIAWSKKGIGCWHRPNSRRRKEKTRKGQADKKRVEGIAKGGKKGGSY